MENVEAFAKNGPQHDNLDNFYVDLNNPELIQTAWELKDELQTIRQDNQRILELNEYLLDKMNKQEKDRRSVIRTECDTSYKPKGKRRKYPNSESSLDIRQR